MKTAVDTNVLLDLLGGEPSAAGVARRALAEAMANGPVSICPVVYTELAANFPSPQEAASFVHGLRLQEEGFSSEALFEAASAWKRYTARRGNDIQCPRCGRRLILHCPTCGAPLTWRQHILADFLIGGYALRQADCLLTRDAGYYRTYFPDLGLIAPGG